jgi:hypothetical protein
MVELATFLEADGITQRLLFRVDGGFLRCRYYPWIR